MCIHEVRGEVKEILKKAVSDRVVLLKLHKVTLLQVTLDGKVCLAHDGKRDVASHLREGQIEVGLVDVIRRDYLAQLWHHERFNVTDVEPALVVRVHTSKQGSWLDACALNASLDVALGGEHLADTCHELLLVNEAISIAIHEIEQTVERVLQQVLSLGREISIFADLRELALEKIAKLGDIEVTVKLNVAHKHLRYIIEGVTVAETEDLLQVLVAALRSRGVIGVCFVCDAILKVSSYVIDFFGPVALHRCADSVLRRYRSCRGSDGAPLLIGRDAGLPPIEALSQRVDQRVGVLMVPVVAQQLERLVVVTRDRISEIIVTAAGQVVDVHVQDSLGLDELLLLAHASGRVLLDVAVFGAVARLLLR